MSTRPDFLREAIESLSGSPIDYDSLLDLVGDARFVLLGEASYGTHEFYRSARRFPSGSSSSAASTPSPWRPTGRMRIA
jgi:hypothetical protein